MCVQFSGRVKKAGFKRGVYECEVNDFYCLKIDEEYTSEDFSVVGFKGKLALKRTNQKCGSPELATMSLSVSNFKTQGGISLLREKELPLRFVGWTGSTVHLNDRLMRRKLHPRNGDERGTA